jgi:hypothetical protein
MRFSGDFDFSKSPEKGFIIYIATNLQNNKEEIMVTLMKYAKRVRHRLRWSLADDIFSPIWEFSGTVCGSSCSRVENLILMGLSYTIIHNISIR